MTILQQEAWYYRFKLYSYLFGNSAFTVCQINRHCCMVMCSVVHYILVTNGCVRFAKYCGRM